MSDRTQRVELRLTSAERRRWLRLASTMGETLSAWLRRLAYEAEQRASAELDER